MQCFIFIMFLFLTRFDIRGLSPGSSEDEAGIKEASELCEKCCKIYYRYLSVYFTGFAVILNLIVTDFQIYWNSNCSLSRYFISLQNFCEFMLPVQEL